MFVFVSFLWHPATWHHHARILDIHAHSPVRLLVVLSLVNRGTLLLSRSRFDVAGPLQFTSERLLGLRSSGLGHRRRVVDFAILFRLPFITSYLLLHLTGFLLHHALSTICNRKNASRAPSTPYTPGHRTPVSWMPQSENDARQLLMVLTRPTRVRTWAGASEVSLLLRVASPERRAKKRQEGGRREEASYGAAVTSVSVACANKELDALSSAPAIVSPHVVLASLPRAVLSPTLTLTIRSPMPDPIAAFLHPAHAPGCRRGVFEWTLHQVRRHRLCTIHARQAGRTEHGQRDAPVLLVAYVLRLLLDGTSRKRRRDGESLLLLMSGGHGARRIGGQWRCRSKMSGLGCPTRSRVWVSASPIVNTWMHFNDLPIVIVRASKDQVGSRPSCCPAIIDFDFGAGPRAGAASGRVANGDSMATVGFLPRPARSGCPCASRAPDGFPPYVTD
ncbi:hypothetical protein C8R45DRAFT_1212267 [Mycena sanguinolenta]|nr:hypothetical protein C8R45DRAFT_1212267 [Mycena sanguinolenta]